MTASIFPVLFMSSPFFPRAIDRTPHPVRGKKNDAPAGRRCPGEPRRQRRFAQCSSNAYAEAARRAIIKFGKRLTGDETDARCPLDEQRRGACRTKRHRAVSASNARPWNGNGHGGVSPGPKRSLHGLGPGATQARRAWRSQSARALRGRGGRGGSPGPPPPGSEENAESHGSRASPTAVTFFFRLV